MTFRSYNPQRCPRGHSSRSLTVPSVLSLHCQTTKRVTWSRNGSRQQVGTESCLFVQGTSGATLLVVKFGASGAP
eukprot:4977106-Amphidinium_carterae.1